MSDKEQLQEMYMELQMVAQHKKMVEQQMQMVEQQRAEMKDALESLTSLEQVKEGTEMWVPVANGIFAKAQVSKTEKLLVNVGAQIAVGKSIGDTQKLLEEQLTESKKLEEKMGEQLALFSKKAEQLQSKLQQLTPENV